MELYRWYILKYGAYALLAVALFRLQSIPGLLEIGGVRPLPVAALAILVATMERELPGVLFCIFCGYLCDLYSVAPMGIYMLLFTILAGRRADHPQLFTTQLTHYYGGGADCGIFLPAGTVFVPVPAGGGDGRGPGAAAVRSAPCRLFGGAGGAAVLPGAGAAPHGGGAHRYPIVTMR